MNENRSLSSISSIFSNYFGQKAVGQYFSKNVLIIGAGQTGELLFRHVTALNPKHIMLANRTIEKAEKITSTFDNASAYYLADLPKLIKKSDIIIAAVNVTEYIVKCDDVGEKPRVFIDISIPQALDPKLGDLEQNAYYCVDDINTVIEGNKDKRKHESSRAQKIIVKSLEDYLEKEKAIISNSAIKELFQKADGLVDLSLEKA
ncbi:NAD(P)-binding domain-containing protein [Francisella noatunensis]